MLLTFRERRYAVLIHSANPQSRPVGIIVFAHVVRPSVRPSVRPHISKQNKFQAKTMVSTGETLGLAEWIIDDTPVLYYLILSLFRHCYKWCMQFHIHCHAILSIFWNTIIQVSYQRMESIRVHRGGGG